MMDEEELAVDLSRESVRLLTRLAENGVYGATAEAVAARFIDEGLQRFVERPKLKMRTE